MCVWKKKTLPCIQHTKQLAPNWHGTPSPNLIACSLLLLPFECFFLYSAYLFCVRRLFLWTAMARIYFRCMYVTMCMFVCEWKHFMYMIQFYSLWFDSALQKYILLNMNGSSVSIEMISFTDFSFKIRTFNVLKAKRREKNIWYHPFILTVSLNGKKQNEQKIKSLMIQRRPKNCPN